jgi:carboxyl-terminal processing protease
MKLHLIQLGLALSLAGALVAAENGTNYAKLPKAELSEFQAGKIAYAAGTMLQVSHYRQTPLNRAISRTHFTNFLNQLDYNRVFFLQTDVDEFAARYADKLGEATLGADASPAFVIYERFKQRVGERQAYVEELLKQDFSFDADDYFDLQRNKKPWPANVQEAEQVWQRRLKYDLLVGRLNKDEPEETLKIVTKRYARLAKTLREFDREEVLNLYLDGLGNAFDPHSDYQPPSERRNFEIHSIKNELTGIGALLRTEDGYCRIVSLTPGGPAEKSGQLGPNDRIVAVAQGEDGEWVDVIEEKLNNVVEIIRGPLGSTVRLEIIPGKGTSSERKVVSLVRDVIKIQDQLPKAQLHLVPVSDTETQRLGVITLPQFHERAADDVATLIGRLKEEKIDGLVLDLRRNGGGILEQATRLTGLFIDQGPVVQVQTYDGRKGLLGDSERGTVYDGPLVVLVSHLSASASEIVAAALQDYGRALVIGDKSTHGKGTVQTLVHLDPLLRPDEVAEPGSLKFTVQTFFRISGETTQKHGVTPDYSLPSTYDYLELGEASLPNALEVKPIAPVRYRAANLVKPHLGQLAQASRARIAVDQEFQYINEDIELLKKQLADRRVSLNLEKRLAEKAEQKARIEGRKAQRMSHASNATKVFEIDLEGAEAGRPMLTLAEIHQQKEAKRLAQEEKDKEHSTDLAAADPEALDLEAVETPEDGRLTDPHLLETLHVLRDYTRLLKGATLAVTSPDAAGKKLKADGTAAVQ